MKKFEIIWNVVFIVMLITSVVLFILDGSHLAAWEANEAYRAMYISCCGIGKA